MSELSVQFGEQVRSLRQGRKMSQEELAFEANISAAHLGQIERGEKKPTLDTIGKIADALNVSLPELFSFQTKDREIGSENTTIDKINLRLKGMSPDEQKDILRIIRIIHRHMK